MKTHKLKIRGKFLRAIVDGSKTFEIRKNDRGFRVGDVIEFEQLTEQHDMNFVYGVPKYVITYILKGGEFGLDDEYCVLSIEALPKEGRNIIVNKIQFAKIIAKFCFNCRDMDDVVRLQQNVIAFQERIEISHYLPTGKDD